tara:strand:- start:502 stop:1251 length:750 start_codon:yes stop_codon:yes gene_type:complete
MAINVNTVYQTVLLILNKEQRGYLTPNEFNKIATQVQLEIFEKYFEDLNQQLRKPGLTEEYADRVDHLNEEIGIFQTYNDCTYDNVTTPNQPFFYLPSDVHRIGTIMYKGEQQIQRTNRGEYLHLYMSKLTRPTTNYPLYIQEGQFDSNAPATPAILHDKIYVYPAQIQSDVSISYIRKPLDVVWGFTSGGLGQYVYDVNLSTNFEISNTEQTEVVLRILGYAGVVIRDPQIVQAAAQQVQTAELNQKT